MNPRDYVNIRHFCMLENFDDLLLFVVPVISQANGDGTQDNRISLLSWLVIVLALAKRGEDGWGIMAATDSQ